MVLAVIVGIAFAALTAASLWVYSSHDRLELIDDPQVLQTADEACRVMTLAVRQSSAPPGANSARKVEAIRQQNAAVTAMIDTILGLGSDRLGRDLPTSSWLADWQTLVDARARYAERVGSDRPPPFVVPTADGEPITERMNDVGIDCIVPGDLTVIR